MPDSASPTEMPPEIVVTERDDDDITFAFPPRQIGFLRLAGLIPLVFSVAILGFIVKIGIGNLPANRPMRPEDYFMVGLGVAIGSSAYYPIWLGLSILGGRRDVTIRGGKLRVTERVGFLWRTKRWPLKDITRVEIVGLSPTTVPKEGTLLSRLDALAGVLPLGKRFMIAPAYPRRLLAPVAAEIARRCNLKFSDRPPVEVATLVQASPVDRWNPGAAPRPSNSKAVVDEYPEGVTITLPPVGYKSVGGAMLLAGVLIAGFMAWLIAVTDAVPAPVRGIFAFVGFIGLLAAIHGARIARRRVVIAVVGSRLLILQTGLVRSKERQWDAGDLAAIRVDKSGIEVNEEPVPELQIVLLGGLKFGLLAGRNVAEITWIAADLRRRLGLAALPADVAAQ
jgi:hypothetical protein